MTFIELLLMGIGLSMDAFAVSVCKGLCMKKINYTHCFVIALFFGGFQALMPFIGFCLGNSLEKYITDIDHWVAFVLLLYIGGKMIYESLHDDGDNTCSIDGRLDIKELFVMAVATSIDALAVGITFSFFENTNIIKNISIIGITTFVIAFGGVVIGNRFGSKYKSKAELAGGAILMILGFKILLEGVGIL